MSLFQWSPICLFFQRKTFYKKSVLCAGSPITPNYADNTTSNVAPWCTCSASGNQRQQCTEFLDYFTNNICLSKSPMHSSDYNTHWSLICLYYIHQFPMSSSEFCSNQRCEVITAQCLVHYQRGYININIIWAEVTEMHFTFKIWMCAAVLFCFSEMNWCEKHVHYNSDHMAFIIMAEQPRCKLVLALKSQVWALWWHICLMSCYSRGTFALLCFPL